MYTLLLIETEEIRSNQSHHLAIQMSLVIEFEWVIDLFFFFCSHKSIEEILFAKIATRKSNHKRKKSTKPTSVALIGCMYICPKTPEV